MVDKIFYVFLTLNMSFLVLLASIISEKKSLIKHAVVPLYTMSFFLLPLSSGWHNVSRCVYICVSYLSFIEILESVDCFLPNLNIVYLLLLQVYFLNCSLYSPLLKFHYMCVSAFKYCPMSLWCSVHFSLFFFFFLIFRLVHFFHHIFKVTNFSAISNLLLNLTSEFFILIIILSKYRMSTWFYFIASILYWYFIFIESSSPHFLWIL